MKKVTTFSIIICFAVSAIIIQSCKKNDSPPAPTATLYDSLGGTAMVSDPANSGQMIEKGRLTIRSVVDSAIFVIAGDAQINSYFTVLLSEVTSGNLSGFEELSKNLTDFFCIGTGAKDFIYTGLSMHDAHDPSINTRISAKVESDDFTEFELDVVAGAGKNGVPSTSPVVASLGKILESLRTAVVNQ